jgi:hypothetical protein
LGLKNINTKYQLGFCPLLYKKKNIYQQKNQHKKSEKTSQMNSLGLKKIIILQPFPPPIPIFI